MFCLIPIIGSGTRDDPYRPSLPAGVAYSAQIPTGPDGRPLYLDAPVWLDDWGMVPTSLITQLKSELAIRNWLSQKGLSDELAGMKRPPQVRDVQALLRRTMAEDDFNRADNVDLGTSWDAGYTGQSNAQIVGNRVRSGAAALDSIESYNAVAFPSDQWARCLVATIQGAGICAPRVSLRMADPPTQSMYEMLALRNVAGEQSRIHKFVAGVHTILANENVTTWAAGDTIAGEAIGTTLTLYRNESTPALLTVTDSSLTSGRAGITVFTDVIADTEIDDWSAGGFDYLSLRNMRYARLPIQKLANGLKGRSR